MGNFGFLYAAWGKYEKAIEYSNSALKMFEICCKDSIRKSLFIGNLAEYYFEVGRIADAEDAFLNALSTRENYFGKDHPGLYDLLINIAKFYLNLENFTTAKIYTERAYKIHTKQLNKYGSDGFQQVLETDEDGLFIHMAVTLSTENEMLRQEAIQFAQMRSNLLAAKAFNINALISSEKSPNIKNLFYDYRDKTDQLKEVSKKIDSLIISTEKIDKTSLDDMLSKQEAIEKKLRDLRIKLANLSPVFKDLYSLKPLLISDVQQLLTNSEAMTVFSVSHSLEHNYAFLVTKDDARAYKIDLSESELEEMVSALRGDIDLSEVVSVGDLPKFDMDLSYELYSKLFGPVEDMLEGVEHLLVVPTGPLESLPLNVLITEKPEVDPAASVFDGYQSAAWLPKKYSLTRLPSVSSLRALRVFASAGTAEEPFIGFGDPILNGDPGALRGLKVVDVYKGSNADLDQLRALPELPETADELKRIAQYLRAPEDKIYLRERATETALKSTDLASSRVVAFATHGLVGGEISGLAEPALVMTPPDEATDEDDGLLKASEVAQLKMNADIILLSACNTASGDKLGAEGLSGLSRAFIYAGARSLLVSHWSVESTSAAELTTGMFDAISSDTKVGRSQALQSSMVDLMSDPDRPYYSHPAFWAPFSLIGDGQTIN